MGKVAPYRHWVSVDGSIADASDQPGPRSDLVVQR